MGKLNLQLRCKKFGSRKTEKPRPIFILKIETHPLTRQDPWTHGTHCQRLLHMPETRVRLVVAHVKHTRAYSHMQDTHASLGYKSSGSVSAFSFLSVPPSVYYSQYQAQTLIIIIYRFRSGPSQIIPATSNIFKFLFLPHAVL
jgi:hypothetical protein